MTLNFSKNEYEVISRELSVEDLRFYAQLNNQYDIVCTDESTKKENEILKNTVFKNYCDIEQAICNEEIMGNAEQLIAMRENKRNKPESTTTNKPKRRKLGF